MPLCFLVATAVASSALGTLARTHDAALGLRLNPLSTQARLAAARAALLADAQRLGEPRWGASLALGRRLAPSEPKMTAALATHHQIAGRDAQAQRLFGLALADAPHDAELNLQAVAFAAQDGDLARAARHVALLGNRNAAIWSLAAPAAGMLADDPQARAVLIEGMGASPVARDRLLRALLKERKQELAAQIVLAWHQRHGEPLPGEVALVTTSLVSARQYAIAYELHERTHGDDRRTDTERVFNGRFASDPKGGPFDWTLLEVPGLTVERRRVAGGASGSPVHEVAFTFRDAPVALDNLRQDIMLRPGPHELRVEYAQRDLRSSRPIRLELGCRYDRSVLARHQFTEGSRPATEATLAFEVPGNEKCPVYRLRLVSDITSNSWRDRSRGELVIRSVAIEAVGDGA